MGIVFKQSAKNLITTYLGFGIGAINTLFLYTNFLQQEYYGLVSFLLSAANLIWPLMAFGVHNTLVKFYSAYDTREEKDKLLSMILFLPVLISILLGVLGIFTYDLVHRSGRHPNHRSNVNGNPINGNILYREKVFDHYFIKIQKSHSHRPGN